MSRNCAVAFLRLFVLVVLLGLVLVPALTDGFIFWKATTTACDICDGIDTNSGRNVACCLLQSKCCGYNSLDEAEAIRANATQATNNVS